MPILGLDPYAPGLGDGLPGEFTLPGTGRSVPAGLEAVLEYNGLFLNIHRNIDYYHVTSIDGLGDADIRDSRDVNTADDGETPYNSFYGGRSIVISGRIMTYSIPKLRDMQQALRAAFADVSQELPLHFRLGDFAKDHVIFCKKISPIAMTEQQQSMAVARDFQITLRASNPRFLSYYKKFFYEDLSPSISGPTEIAVLNNIGNYWAQPVYRIWGGSTSTTIFNDTTGKSFTVNNVPFGGYFEFDTAKKTLKDNLGVNQWNNLADDSEYVSLRGYSPLAPTGDNVILYQGDSPRVEISWYDSWV